MHKGGVYLIIFESFKKGSTLLFLYQMEHHQRHKYILVRMLMRHLRLLSLKSYLDHKVLEEVHTTYISMDLVIATDCSHQ